VSLAVACPSDGRRRMSGRVQWGRFLFPFRWGDDPLDWDRGIGKGADQRQEGGVRCWPSRRAVQSDLVEECKTTKAREEDRERTKEGEPDPVTSPPPESSEESGGFRLGPPGVTSDLPRPELLRPGCPCPASSRRPPPSSRPGLRGPCRSLGTRCRVIRRSSSAGPPRNRCSTNLPTKVRGGGASKDLLEKPPRSSLSMFADQGLPAFASPAWVSPRAWPRKVPSTWVRSSFVPRARPGIERRSGPGGARAARAAVRSPRRSSLLERQPRGGDRLVPALFSHPPHLRPAPGRTPRAGRAGVGELEPSAPVRAAEAAFHPRPETSLPSRDW